MARLASGRASRTARMTAAIRYRHYLGGTKPLVIADRDAGIFVDWRSAAWAMPTPVSDWAFGRALGPMRGIEGEVLARSRFVEDRFDALIGDGLAQVLVLGAGFDTMALRHAKSACRFFEVDHPATQAEKRAILRQKRRASDHIRFVPVDFASDDLAASLLQASFDCAPPTLVSWLGVTMYLDQAVMIDTLTRLRPLLAPGSELVFDAYPRTAELAPGDELLFAAMKAFTASRGEPMIGAFNSPAFASAMANSGYAISEILTGDDMADRWFANQSRMIRPPRSVLLYRLTVI